MTTQGKEQGMHGRLGIAEYQMVYVGDIYLDLRGSIFNS